MVPTMMAHAGAVTDLAELPLCAHRTRGRPNRLAHPANGPCRIVQQRHPPGGRRRQPRIAARQPIRRGRSRSGHRPGHRCRQDLAQHWLYPDYFGSAVARNRGATADVDRGHRYGAPRAKLSRRRRSGGGCVAADTTMSAIARHLGVGWDTCWAAVNTAAQARIADPDRVQGVKAIGVDEHVWRPSRTSAIEMDRISLLRGVKRSQLAERPGLVGTLSWRSSRRGSLSPCTRRARSRCRGRRAGRPAGSEGPRRWR